MKSVSQQFSQLVLTIERLEGESPSITRREWQREIDQIISRQTLL